MIVKGQKKSMSNINKPPANESWEKTLLPIESTLRQVINKLNETTFLIVCFASLLAFVIAAGATFWGDVPF